LWVTADNSKTEEKERMKAIAFIIQCYNKGLELLKYESEVNGIKEYIETVKRAAKQIERREKALQAYLEGRKLEMNEIYKATDPNRVF
jgi:hypothetical protein